MPGSQQPISTWDSIQVQDNYIMHSQHLNAEMSFTSIPPHFFYIQVSNKY